MLLSEIKQNGYRKVKAGIIPFYFDEDKNLKMLFMVSSNQEYGGLLPMVSKGHIDGNESPENAAIREGIQEVGLKISNFKSDVFHVYYGELQGDTEKYEIVMSAIEINDPKDFSKPHYETAKTVWLTLDNFMKKGRQSQKELVSYSANKILSTK